MRRQERQRQKRRKEKKVLAWALSILMAAGVFCWPGFPGSREAHAASGANAVSPAAKGIVNQIDGGSLNGKRIYVQEFEDMDTELRQLQEVLDDAASILEQKNRIYVLHFEANDSEEAPAVGVPEDVEYPLNEESGSLPLAEEVQREGYRFTGWNTAADGSGKDVPDGGDILNATNGSEQVFTLYAQWEKIEDPGDTPGDEQGDDPGSEGGDDPVAEPVNIAEGVEPLPPYELLQAVVPAGRYDLGDNSALRMDSNTILDLRGGATEIGKYHEQVTIHTGSRNGAILLAGGDGERLPKYSRGYDFYNNLTVLGGNFVGTTASGEKIRGCNVRFGHARNVNIIGMQIKNNHDGHHLELGAVDGLLVANCRFTGQTENADKPRAVEALQLDITHRDEDNFAGYGACDDLPCINVTIEYCSFENVNRGVGSHHSVTGAGNKPVYKNIKILHNDFRNIPDRGINAEYFQNAEIAYNTMSNVNSGILVTNMISSQFYQPNKGTWTPMSAAADRTLNMNTKVHDNSIQLRADLGPWRGQSTKYGIKLGGEKVAAGKGNDGSRNPNYNGKTLLAGDYYVTGVDIYNNSVKALAGSKKSIDFGIYLDHANNCKIRNNSIALAGQTGGTGNGFGIRHMNGSGNLISGNVISGAKRSDQGSGIALGTGSKNAVVTGNSISDGNIGIKMHQSAQAKTVNNNVIRTMNNYPVLITDKGSVSGTLSNNNIAGNAAGKNAIQIVGGAKIAALSGNKISGKFNMGISLSQKASVTNIMSNTITGAAGSGIFLNEKGTYAFRIKSNKVVKAKNAGLRVKGGARANHIQKNKFSGCKYNKAILEKGLSFISQDVSVKKKKSVKLKIVNSSKSGKIKYSSSNKKIATVNAKGKVSGKKKGKVTITAKKNGLSVKCKVTVK